MQQHGWIFEAILSKNKTILRAAGLCEELCTLSFWSSVWWQALTIAHFLAVVEAASRGWRAVALTLGTPCWSPQRMKSTGGGKCLPWWWGWRSPFAWTSGLKLSCFSGQEVDRNLSSVPGSENWDKLFAGLIWVVCMAWPKRLLITDLLYWCHLWDELMCLGHEP